MMVGNAETERCFICQNQIKTKQLSNLTVEHLDQLMRINCSGVGWRSLTMKFDYDFALTQFAKAIAFFVGYSRIVKICCQ